MTRRSFLNRNHSKIEMVNARRHSYAITWDKDKTNYYIDGRPATAEQVKGKGFSLLGERNAEEMEGSIIWWTYD